MKTFIGNRVYEIQTVTKVNRWSKNYWPNTVEFIDPPEKRTPKVQVFLTFTEQNIFAKFSSLVKLQRVFAYCFRFIRNVKSTANRRLGSLTAEEIELSFQFLIKQAQLQDFSSEITCLQQNKPISIHSKLIF